MKNCAEIKKILPEYYYEELDAAEKAEVAAHLQDCAACAKEYETVKSALQVFSKEKRPELSGSLYYDAKERLSKRVDTSYKLWNLPLTVGMGVLLLLAGISYNTTMPSYKDLDIEEVYIETAALESGSQNLTDIDFDMLADDIFLEDNLMTFGS